MKAARPNKTAEVPAEFLELEEVFLKLEHKKGLKLRGLKKEEIEKVKQTAPRDQTETSNFLFYFLTEWNLKYPTVNSLGVIVTPLKNPDYTTVNGKNRSVQEVYDVITTYFPNYTVFQYFQDIYRMAARLQNNTVDQIKKAKKNKISWKSPFGLFGLVRCPDIKRDVFSFDWCSTRYTKCTYPSYDHLPPNLCFPVYLVARWHDSDFWKQFHKQKVAEYLTRGLTKPKKFQF